MEYGGVEIQLHSYLVSATGIGALPPGEEQRYQLKKKNHILKKQYYKLSTQIIIIIIIINISIHIIS